MRKSKNSRIVLTNDSINIDCDGLLLEECSEIDLPHKLAYWKHLIFPEPERDLKYGWKHKTLNKYIYSIHPDYVNDNDYERIN